MKLPSSIPQYQIKLTLINSPNNIGNKKISLSLQLFMKKAEAYRLLVDLLISIIIIVLIDYYNS